VFGGKLRYNSLIINLMMSTGRQEKAAGLEELYGEGDFIDAKDSQGDWRVGFIVARYEHTKVLKVRFDGWPTKYDEVRPLPLRTTSSAPPNSNPSGPSSSATPDNSKIPPSGTGSFCRTRTKRYPARHAENQADLGLLGSA
jgi:hypothetical protein